MGQRAPENGQAWRPDDALHPQSLPNLSKQHSFSMSSDRHYGTISLLHLGNHAPYPMKIDLDRTDLSFLPCLCGFRLCLFCHKRVLEEDGCCPGCRKQYDHDTIEGEVTLDGGTMAT